MIKVRQLTGTIGAEVTGIDLSQELGNDVFNAVQDALNENLVLVFPGQDLTAPQQSRFSQLFGPVEAHPYGSRPGIEEAPEVIVLETKPGRRGARNDFWHSDVSSAERPPALSLLHARIVPDGRGDTLFCNMYRAFETLSPGLQKALLGMHAMHTPEAIRRRNEAEPGTDSPQMGNLHPPVKHPAIRTHPHTGRNALYVNPFFTERFADMTIEESRPLLEYLHQRSTQPENIYRHRWRVGDLVVWDNRCTMHYAVRDYDENQPRRMHRTTAGGERPFLTVPGPGEKASAA